MISLELERKLFDDAMESIDKIASAHDSSKISTLELIEYGRTVTKIAGKFGEGFIAASRQLKRKKTM